MVAQPYLSDVEEKLHECTRIEQEDRESTIAELILGDRTRMSGRGRFKPDS